MSYNTNQFIQVPCMIVGPEPYMFLFRLNYLFDPLTI